MSSVRVNLIPREAEERERARRAVGVLIVAGLVAVVILIGLFFLQVSRVGDAREALEQAEAERNELQRELDSLDQYANLEERRDLALELLTATMATEWSAAGVLQDVAAVMPSDAALTSLSVTIGEGPEAPTDFDFGGPRFGTLTATGDSLRGHAPGVERFLLEFDKVAAFFNVFVNTSAVDETGISTFSFESDLGPEVFTGRYLEGLPEELR